MQASPPSTTECPADDTALVSLREALRAVSLAIGAAERRDAWDGALGYIDDATERLRLAATVLRERLVG
jgi:hypothetical protein